MITSVLDSIPTYYMSLLPIPCPVLKQLDGLRRLFLWQGNRPTSSIWLSGIRPLSLSYYEVWASGIKSPQQMYALMIVREISTFWKDME